MILALAASLSLVLAAPQGAPQESLVFSGPGAVVLNFVKADRVEQFEAALADLRRALETSDNPVRRQQGEGWRVFSAAEPGPDGTAIFVFVVNPVLRGADYSVKAVVEDAFDEAEARRVVEAFGQSLASVQVFNVESLPSPGSGEAHEPRQQRQQRPLGRR